MTRPLRDHPLLTVGLLALLLAMFLAGTWRRNSVLGRLLATGEPPETGTALAGDGLEQAYLALRAVSAELERDLTERAFDGEAIEGATVSRLDEGAPPGPLTPGTLYVVRSAGDASDRRLLELDRTLNSELAPLWAEIEALRLELGSDRVRALHRDRDPSGRALAPEHHHP